MAITQQTFGNRKDGPIYVSIEPWPECFELEPGDELTLIWDAEESGESMTVEFVNESELVVCPIGNLVDIKFLLNGLHAEERSWDFKHR